MTRLLAALAFVAIACCPALAAIPDSVILCDGQTACSTAYRAPDNTFAVELQHTPGRIYSRVAQAQPPQSPGPVIGQTPLGSPVVVAPAQKAGGMIDIGQAFSDTAAPYINAVVNAFILGAIGFAAKKFNDWTGIRIEQKHQDTLTKALQNQAGSLIADGLAKVSATGKVEVSSDRLAAAANDAMRSIPDAIRHFGLDENYIAKRIVDTIPQLAAGAQMVANAAAPTAGKA